jgi:alpha-glucuronidase
MKGTSLSGMSAVSNIGSDPNWCGHHFAQGSLYAYGRLCWDPDLDPRDLAREWLEQTFCRDSAFVEPALGMMMVSHQAVVDYMTPLGLHHIMGYDHHQGPAPWIDQGRPDWTCVYYHRADEEGLGFDRTSKGSGALAQYAEPYRRQMEDFAACPLDYLLWYHHVPWDQELSSGNSLWNELCLRYQRGVDRARDMKSTWTSLAPHVDALRHAEVAARLARQISDAVWWKDACLSYFRSWSKRPLPEGVEAPLHTLSEYQAITHYFVPGIPERRF